MITLAVELEHKQSHEKLLLHESWSNSFSCDCLRSGWFI